MAELIGDTPKVAYDHYGKEWSKSYADPLWAAIGGGQKTATKPSAAVCKKSRSAPKKPR